MACSLMALWATMRKYNISSRVSKNSLRNWLSYVPDLIQDIQWEIGQHKQTPQKTPPATARLLAIPHTGGHRPV